MIVDLDEAEINEVGGSALEGATATAGLLATGFGVLAAVPTPASPALLAAAAITGTIAGGLAFFGSVYGGSGANGATGGKKGYEQEK